MARFSVTAVTKDDEQYHEVVEATDRFSVYHDIRDRGDRIIDVKEEGRAWWASLLSFSLFSSVSLDDKVILTRNLAAMLEAGLTISRALGVMERQSKNKKLKSVLGSMIGEVKGGGTFSAALSKFPGVFPALLVSMVRAGEESGKMAEALRVVSTQMERSSNLTKKIRGALIYPAIVVLAMVGIGILMLIYVVPTLTQTFNEVGAKLPPTTQFIISASTFLTEHTLLALGGFFVFILFLVTLARTTQGRFVLNWLFLRIPVISSLVKETYSARTARTLASLLSAGVDMIFSITITRDVVANIFYQRVLEEAEASVIKGGQISATLVKYPNLYPPMVAEMIAVGEETGRLSEMLKETATFYEESVEQQTKDLSTIIEPLLMVMIGGFVGFFAISMIAPIYSLSNGI